MRDQSTDTGPQNLREEVQHLRERLAEAEETLRAIREGEVDAIVVSGAAGDRVFSLTGSEQIYRLIVETMAEAAVTLALDGTILFCNERFCDFLGLAQYEILGHPLAEFLAADERGSVPALMAKSQSEPIRRRLVFQGPNRRAVPAHISTHVLPQPNQLSICLVATDLSELETSNQLLQEVRRQREALLLSEERLRVTLRSIGDAVISTDMQGRVTFLNPVGAALTGWSPEEAMGQRFGNVLRIVDEITQQPGEDLVGRVLTEGCTIQLANHSALIARDGSQIPIEDSAAPILDAAGCVVGVVVVFHDVTKARQVRDALREGERKFSALFGNSLNGMAHCRTITDEQGRPVDYQVLRVNDAYERIIGIKREHIEGRLITQVFPDIPNYSASFIAMYGKIALEGGEHTSEEFFEGTGQYLSIYVYSPVRGEFIAMFTDVTARRRAEEAVRAAEKQFRAFFENVAVGTAQMNMDGRFVEVNGRYCEIAGYSRDELLRMTAQDLTHPDDSESDRRRLAAYLAGETPSYNAEKRYVRKDGQVVWVQVSAALIRDDQGRPLRSAGVIQDITARKQAEQELRAALERGPTNSHAKRKWLGKPRRGSSGT